MLFGETREIAFVAGGDYGSVMEALFRIKAGTASEIMRKYEPLMFLTVMTHADSRAWVSKALEEYQATLYVEGEARSWPAERCLKVLQARKARKANRKAAAEVKG